MKAHHSFMHISSHELATENMIEIPSPSHTATLLLNAAKQKKILFKVKAQPWDQRPAAPLINISLRILYFSLLFHRQALR